MSMYMQDILNYGEDVNDFEISPFESVQMLHNRSEIQTVFHELSLEEQQLLAEYDAHLFKNVHKMYRHIKKAYDFNLSNQPNDEWWWHLDKVMKGTIKVGLTTGIGGKVM
ncbi:hypothetical protein [Niallia sp. 01092]|uniref:hypothetical protein n=1 Tax=unclassified Niallia TaxID=2837522 RepID=UPI003FCFCBF0